MELALYLAFFFVIGLCVGKIVLCANTQYQLKLDLDKILNLVKEIFKFVTMIVVVLMIILAIIWKKIYG